ncbi:MAG: YbaK/prolyl-tRNA synthetase associated domain-containing protein, partial [Enterobacter sp.]|nr:YbaK/prolyl-tRNA synthetase associated domain-containing protein [Enterobacter sp.]
MTDDVIGAGTHQQLITLLTEQGARFRVMEHEAVGKCEAVS